MVATRAVPTSAPSLANAPTTDVLPTGAPRVITATPDVGDIHEHRVTYRVIVALLGSLLVSLVLGRGYGLDVLDQVESASSGEVVRRVDGDWTSVPFGYAGDPTATRVRLTVPAEACARVVRHDVIETTDRVIITVWRRAMHPSCTALSVAVELRSPLGGRAVVDGGVLGS